MTNPAPTTPEELPEHLLRPHLRPIEPVPVQKDGKRFVALRDRSMIETGGMCVIPVQGLPVLQRFYGKRTLDEIADEVNTPRADLVGLVRELDRLGLLWGPTFERLERERLERIRAAGAFPIRSSRSLGEDDAACRATLDRYFDETEDPELDGEVRAIVAPHLDYARGWPNYAAAYHPVRHADAPDRVVILGTNHFGIGDGVVMTEFGVETPLGCCHVDKAVTSRLVDRLGDQLTIDQLDHLPEHSIELHVPWIQHCFGEVPIVPALVPNPLNEMIAKEGRVDAPTFVTALRETLSEVGGRTLYIASSDLSHVGPYFGEPRPVDEQRRIDVEQHDRDMMGKFLTGDAEEFLAAMRWCKNPTSWCSIGNMIAVLMLVEPEVVELIDYRQAFDEKGHACRQQRCHGPDVIAVAQRVSEARVSVAATGYAAAIGPGLCVLLGVERGDGDAEAVWMAGKLARLRIFRDDEDRMNRSVQDIGGAVLLVSQFTLAGDCAKGNRPSFIRAADPPEGERLYELVARTLRTGERVPVETGVFGAMMEVALVNDGPVTLIVERRPAAASAP